MGANRVIGSAAESGAEPMETRSHLNIPVVLIVTTVEYSQA